MWFLHFLCSKPEKLMLSDSTRVSNELGAGMIDRAKNAMAVTLKLVVLLALIIDLALTFGHNIWAGFFADSQEIVHEFASMTPFLVISITFDTLQCILSGFSHKNFLKSLIYTQHTCIN